MNKKCLGIGGAVLEINRCPVPPRENFSLYAGGGVVFFAGLWPSFAMALARVDGSLVGGGARPRVVALGAPQFALCIVMVFVWRCCCLSLCVCVCVCVPPPRCCNFVCAVRFVCPFLQCSAFASWPLLHLVLFDYRRRHCTASAWWRRHAGSFLDVRTFASSPSNCLCCGSSH